MKHFFNPLFAKAILFLVIFSIDLFSGPRIDFKAMPIFDYDPDMGFGFGAYGEALLLSKDTTNKDTCFIQGRIYGTTASVLFPFIQFEYKKISFSDLNIRAEIDRMLYANYFGFGNSDDQLGYNELKAKNYYYYYGRTNPFVTFIYGIYPFKKRSFFSSSEFSLGIRMENYWIYKSPKQPSDGGEPLLFSEKPLGISGGFIHEEIAGFKFDNRNNSFNPTSGFYYEILCSISDKTLLSSYSYFHSTSNLSFYFIPSNKLDWITLCSRLLVNYLHGNAPFFKYETTLAIDPLDIFGGRGSMRGIQQYRYKDSFCYIVSPECRFKISKLHVRGYDWSLSGVLFSDIGNTFPSPLQIKSEAYCTYGSGLRLGWGNDFILSFDLGIWRSELSGIYVYFGQQF